MNITSGLVNAVNASQPGVQQTLSIEMLRQSQVMDKQAADLIIKSTQSDDYNFSIYV